MMLLNRVAVRAAIASLVTMIASGGALAQTWTQWRGPNRDGQTTVAAPATWEAKPTQVWNVAVGAGYSSPLVAGGRVYLHTRRGEQEVVTAFDLQTGKPVWTQQYAAPYRVNSAAASHGPGPKSTPVLSGGKLYTLGISGILSCFDAATGTPQWRKSFEKEFKTTSPEYGVAMSPIVDGGLLIAHIGGKDNGALRAFDAQTGQIKWSWTEDGPGYASPIAIDVGGTHQIVTQTQKFIVGIDPANGATLWRVPFATDYEQNSVTPVVYKDTVIFSGLSKGTFALRLARQGSTWTANKAWENTNLSMYMNSPVLVGDTLIGLSHRNSGQFFAMDAGTGATRWTSPPRQAENAAIIAAGRTIFLLTDGGQLIVLDAAATGYKPIKTYEVATSSTWAHPVVLGSRVLIKDNESLALLTIGSGSSVPAPKP